MCLAFYFFKGYYHQSEHVMVQKEKASLARPSFGVSKCWSFLELQAAARSPEKPCAKWTDGLHLRGAGVVKFPVKPYHPVLYVEPSV